MQAQTSALQSAVELNVTHTDILAQDDSTGSIGHFLSRFLLRQGGRAGDELLGWLWCIMVLYSTASFAVPLEFGVLDNPVLLATPKRLKSMRLDAADFPMYGSAGLVPSFRSRALVVATLCVPHIYYLSRSVLAAAD